MDANELETKRQARVLRQIISGRTISPKLRSEVCRKMREYNSRVEFKEILRAGNLRREIE